MPQLPPEFSCFLHKCGLRKERFADIDQLEKLRLKLVEANRKTNLTRIVEPREYWCKHIADSLALGLALPTIFSKTYRVADVGCGAGFPLLPLAWANHNLQLVGIDTQKRKTAFIEEAAAELGLRNCRVVTRQVREVGDLPEYQDEFDLIVARAVADAARLLKESRKLLKKNSEAQIILYKTPEQITTEKKFVVRAAGKFGFKLRYSDIYSLPCNCGKRQFIIAAKLDH